MEELTMRKISRHELYTLEHYDRIRADFRRRVMAHKKNRRLPVGPHATLYFEDTLTMHYQVQEMLRAERIFDARGIQDELDAYNPLIPDGTNWKATFMIEFDDPDERRLQLARLVGIENRVWMKADNQDCVFPIADEDLERATEEKTSSVHFLRFDLDDEMIRVLKGGAPMAAGIDHPAYCYTVDPVPEDIRLSLLNDLD